MKIETTVDRFAINVKKIVNNEKIFSIGDLEHACGLSPGYISRIIKGTVKNITLRDALNIAYVLDMTIDEIIDYKSKDEIIAEKIATYTFEQMLKEFSKDDLISYIEGASVESYIDEAVLKNEG